MNNTDKIRVKYGFDTGKIRVTALLVVMAALLLVGCRPKGVMSPGKMRDVLYDLHRADAILQMSGYNYGHDEALAQYYSVVLSKHGVTQADLDSSLTWYTAHPNRFERIYPRLIKRMEQDQEAYKQMRELHQSQPKVPHDVLQTIDPARFDSLLDVYRHGWSVEWGCRMPEPIGLFDKIEENEEN